MLGDHRFAAMPVIALEEHFAAPEIVEAWRRLDPASRDTAFPASTSGEMGRRLLDLGEERLAAMDETGVDIQVISHTSPGVQNLAPNEAIVLQREANDRLAQSVTDHPDRFQAFATLATPAPEQAAVELERTVTQLGFQGGMVFGRTGEDYLDHPRFGPLFEAANELRAPLYLHPQSPTPAVRTTLYGGLGPLIDDGFATHGIGWHYEAGIQLLRLMLRGVFDRFPALQIVIGHWGEVVLFYLERMEHIALAAGLPRTLAEYIRDHVWVTPSGMLSPRYLDWTIELLGDERVMFSTDYPFEGPSQKGARTFLEDAPLTPDTRRRIASENWNRLTSASAASERP